jgi:small subunit ribosomal protein S18
MYCVDKITHVDYKNIDQLRNFLTDRAKIQARRQSGCCAKHQRAMTRAVKRAREIALLPFVAGS